MAWYRRLLVHYEAPGRCGEDACPTPAPPPFNFGNTSTLVDFPESTTTNWNSPDNVGIPPYPTDVTIPFHKGTTGLTVAALVICIVLATCFLVLIFYRALRRRRRRRLRRRVLLANAEAAGGGGDDDDDDDDVAVDDGDIHHVWYIRTVGLDQNTIDSITICHYKSGDGLIDTTDCTVCLSVFHEEELVRLLPKCNHAFHISCIDTWLRSHVNCPLCRAPVVAPPPPAPAFTNDLGPSSTTSGTTTVESNQSGVAPSEENQNLQTNVGEDGAIENSGIAFPPPVQRSSSSSVSVLGSGFRVQSDLGLCGGKTVVRNNTGDSAATRRSFSVDFAAMGVLLGEATEGSPCQDRKESSFVMLVPRGGVMEKQWSGRKAASSRGMERSASTNGGKLFLSRFSRGRGNSFLPP